jgi:hypothetical protein
LEGTNKKGVPAERHSGRGIKRDDLGLPDHHFIIFDHRELAKLPGSDSVTISASFSDFLSYQVS